MSTVGNNSTAVVGQANGTGSVTINCGVLTTTGSNSNGVFSFSNGGNMVVNITSATTSGAGAFGLTSNTSGTGTEGKYQACSAEEASSADTPPKFAP